MSELKDLCGKSMLDGVDFQNVPLPAYDGAAYTEDSQVCRFRLNGTGLDTLIPLNLKAATALSIAYEDFGTWRDEAELLARAAASDRAYRLAKEGV